MRSGLASHQRHRNQPLKSHSIVKSSVSQLCSLNLSSSRRVRRDCNLRGVPPTTRTVCATRPLSRSLNPPSTRATCSRSFLSSSPKKLSNFRTLSWSRADSSCTRVTRTRRVRLCRGVECCMRRVTARLRICPRHNQMSNRSFRLVTQRNHSLKVNNLRNRS